MIIFEKKNELALKELLLNLKMKENYSQFCMYWDSIWILLNFHNFIVYSSARIQFHWMVSFASIGNWIIFWSTNQHSFIPFEEAIFTDTITLKTSCCAVVFQCGHCNYKYEINKNNCNSAGLQASLPALHQSWCCCVCTFFVR